MIQDSSGIESYKTFSAAKARTVGRDKGRFDWLTLASSAEDFKGLLYRLLGNGKKGETQYEFLKTNLIDPYNRAEDSIIQAKISAANDFMALKEQVLVNSRINMRFELIFGINKVCQYLGCLKQILEN
jgi:hypothetical protein